MPEAKVPEATVGPDESVETAPHGKYLLYGVGLALVAAASLAFAVFLSSIPWFMTHDAYPAMYQSGYGIRLNHEDCDVVLFGDSSALTGLDPRVVERMTGLKSCNISEVGGVTVVMGSMYPIDRYLENNKRPRFLVLMYSHNQNPPFLPAFSRYAPEGVLYGLQYDRSARFYAGLLKRPVWMAKYSVWVGYSVLNGFAQWVVKPHAVVTDTRAERAGMKGLYPFPLPPETSCVQSAQFIDPSVLPGNAKVIEEMRERYSVGGTQVLVDVSPMPDCSNFQDDYKKKLAGLHDNALESVPLRYFNDDDVHLSPEGATYVSTEVGAQILTVLKQQDGRGQRVAGGVQ